MLPEVYEDPVKAREFCGGDGTEAAVTAAVMTVKMIYTDCSFSDSL